MKSKGLTRKGFGCSLLGALGAMVGCPGCMMSRSGLRYACKGELHKDFHASILDGIDYLADNYGEAAAKDVLKSTAQKVYRTMHEKLVRGDSSELVEWWRYYMDREQADYSLKEKDDGQVVLAVSRCPALAHLEKRGIPGGRRVCRATHELNDALCEGSPFEIALEDVGECGCCQILRRKA